MFFLTSKKYHHVGRVEGRFYDSEGNPTGELDKVCCDSQGVEWKEVFYFIFYLFFIFSQVAAALVDTQKMEDDEKQSRDDYPLCNSAWAKDVVCFLWIFLCFLCLLSDLSLILFSQEKKRFWCSERSGGKQRDWAGYPRKVLSPKSKRPRCGCAEDPNDKNPELGFYEGCNPNSFECFVDQEKKN